MTATFRSFKRGIASCALLVWCALAAVIPAADAAAERASVGSRAHIEATGGSATCVPVHDHLACQLCRLLRLAGNTDASWPDLVAGAAAESVSLAYVRPLAGKRIEPSASPRAPPSA